MPITSALAAPLGSMPVLGGPLVIAARPMRCRMRLSGCCEIILRGGGARKICGNFLHATQIRLCGTFWLAMNCRRRCVTPRPAACHMDWKVDYVTVSNFFEARRPQSAHCR